MGRLSKLGNNKMSCKDYLASITKRELTDSERLLSELLKEKTQEYLKELAFRKISFDLSLTEDNSGIMDFSISLLYYNLSIDICIDCNGKYTCYFFCEKFDTSLKYDTIEKSGIYNFDIPLNQHITNLVNTMKGFQQLDISYDERVMNAKKNLKKQKKFVYLGILIMCLSPISFINYSNLVYEEQKIMVIICLCLFLLGLSIFALTKFIMRRNKKIIKDSVKK